MRMRNKGKVHPFTSSASSSYNPNDPLSVLNLLPAAIFTLISVLSLEDREVLAYMVTRSLKSTNPSFFPAEDTRKGSKKQFVDGHDHKSQALFDCVDCFHCYTSFWVRWDSSPNRELIHQAIEAFEEHLNNGELFKRGNGNGKNRRKEKMGRRKNEKIGADGGDSGGADGVLELPPENQESGVLAPPEMGGVEVEEVSDVGGAKSERAEEAVGPGSEAAEEVEAPAVVVRSHKGFARKVLPDVMGIFGSRLWRLWSPDV